MRSMRQAQSYNTKVKGKSYEKSSNKSADRIIFNAGS